jgi:molybdopterin-guanine dinucleotide biosynthesis protein A
MNADSLHGLVLAGGRSTRMGTDKALLSYGSRPQLDVCFELLQRHCAGVFVSTRPGLPREGFPVIEDTVEGIGPMAGILSALEKEPNAAWLVLACDLPFVDDATLEFLIAHRNPAKVATAFLSAHDQLPEPMCAIYEPAFLARARELVAQGITCPRKSLIRSDIEKLALPNPKALDNINHPHEFEAARQPGAKLVRLRYHAMLREQIGHSEEMLETSAGTPGALYDELSSRHGFRLQKHLVRVAVNNEVTAWDVPLKSGDTVSFIPPVAGG